MSNYPPVMLNRRKEENGVVTALFAVVFVLLVAFLFADLWVTRTIFEVEVSGLSMVQTLDDGDILYADKTKPFSRGDIVIIDVSDYKEEYPFEGDYIIKRVIATEGDVVRCIGGEVSVKYAGEEEFTPLNEPYANGETSSFAEVEVGEGEIFFLGDNRGNSTDSRRLGCYEKTDVVGVVLDWSVEEKGERSRLELCLRYFGLIS